MAVPKPTPQQRAKDLIEAKIFQHYQTGTNILDVCELLGVTYSFVNSRFFAWDMAKEQARKEIERYNSPFEINFCRPKNTDFALITNDNEVIEAYNRMITPKLKLKKAS